MSNTVLCCHKLQPAVLLQLLVQFFQLPVDCHKDHGSIPEFPEVFYNLSIRSSLWILFYCPAEFDLSHILFHKASASCPSLSAAFQAL